MYPVGGKGKGVILWSVPRTSNTLLCFQKKGGEGLSRGLFIKFGVFKDYRTYLALTKVTQLDDLSLHT